MTKIFLVEDDDNIRELIGYALKTSGFETEGFENSRDFWRALEAETPVLIILDIMLPDEDGITILKKLRSNSETKKVPVIMLTAKSSESDKIKGLDLGADDYITKPFSVLELISRTKAVLRRADDNKEKRSLIYKTMEIDLNGRTVKTNGDSITLTYKEFELLHCLMSNIGIVLSREKIMELVWGFNFEGESRTVDMHIKTLRQKLGESGILIKTIRGVGYKIGE